MQHFVVSAAVYAADHNALPKHVLWCCKLLPNVILPVCLFSQSLGLMLAMATALYLHIADTAEQHAKA